MSDDESTLLIPLSNAKRACFYAWCAGFLFGLFVMGVIAVVVTP